MANCQACGADFSELDRFCRSCGRKIATASGEKANTSRLNSGEISPPIAQSFGEDPTIKFYDPPVAYAMAQDFSASYPVESAGKRMLHHWGVWFVIPLLLSILIAAGITIGINSRRDGPRIQQPNQAEIARRSYQETIRNAMGFNAGSISASEYPDVQGIFIASLMSDDSPAALAGIQAGDILTEINDQGVRNAGELAQALETIQPGVEVALGLHRDGVQILSRMRIADRSFPPLVPKMPPKEQGFLGIYDSNRRCCIPGTKRWGVEVQKISDNSPAYLGGLFPGDVITEFAGHAVRTPEELARRIRSVKPRSKVEVKLYRGNTEQVVELITGHR